MALLKETNQYVKIENLINTGSGTEVEFVTYNTPNARQTEKQFFNEIKNFINSATNHMATEFNKIDEFIKSNNITTEEEFNLTSMKTVYLDLCNKQNELLFLQDYLFGFVKEKQTLKHINLWTNLGFNFLWYENPIVISEKGKLFFTDVINTLPTAYLKLKQRIVNSQDC